MEQAGRKICRVRIETDGRARLKDVLDGGRGSKERRRRTRPAAGTPIPRTGARPESARPPSSRSPPPGSGIRACLRLYAAAPLPASTRGSALSPSERRIRWIPRPPPGVPVSRAIARSVPMGGRGGLAPRSNGPPVA